MSKMFDALVKQNEQVMQPAAPASTAPTVEQKIPVPTREPVAAANTVPERKYETRGLRRKLPPQPEQTVDDERVRTTIYLPPVIDEELTMLRARSRVNRSAAIISSLDTTLHRTFICTKCEERVCLPDYTGDKESRYRCPLCGGSLLRFTGAI